jgi:uncharacterized protein (DUF58 family)
MQFISSLFNRRRTDQALLDMLRDPRTNKTAFFLFAMILIGLLGMMPDRYDQQISFRSSIFIIFPAFVFIFARIYFNLIKGQFQLVHRELPKVCLEGEMIEVKLKLRYTGNLPFGIVTLSDHFPAVDILESPEVIVTDQMVDAAGYIECSYRHRLNRGFGNFNIGPLTLVVKDPFSFYEQKVKFDLSNNLQVWLNPPAPEDLDLIKQNALTPIGDSRSVLAGSGMDFYGIKEYMHGDDIRAMCWPKTAQVGKPVLKTFEKDTRPDVFLALHTDKKALKGFGFGNTMKRLFRLSAAILEEVQKAGLQSIFSAVINNEPRFLSIPANISVFAFMTELLAEVKPAEDNSLESLLSLALKKVGPGSVFIMLSHTINLPIETLVSAFLVLQARGAKVSLWAIDDSDQTSFSEFENSGLTKAIFFQRLKELNFEVHLFSSKTSAMKFEQIKLEEVEE